MLFAFGITLFIQPTVVNGESMYHTLTNNDYHIFTMGDNRPDSGDSREIGAINIDDVIGRVYIRLYPFNKIGTVK